MGMYAGYYRISDAELEQLRQLEERALLKRVEELTEDETAETCDLDKMWDVLRAEVCDLDKMWDALHFVLTGDTLSDTADHDPLSEAVCGSDFLLTQEMHVGGIPARRVKEIAQALHEVDFAARLAALQMSDFAAAEIYPNIWDRPEEEDDIRAELQECFADLQAFYDNAAEQGNAVLVMDRLTGAVLPKDFSSGNVNFFAEKSCKASNYVV